VKQQLIIVEAYRDETLVDTVIACNAKQRRDAVRLFSQLGYRVVIK
jgi:hypothetical protein